MGIRIRDAVADDLPAVISTDSVAAADDGTRGSEIREWVARGAARVAETEGEIVGYCVMEDTFFGHGFVSMLMVAAHVRGRGVGAGLLDDARRRRRTAKLFTSTNLSNHPMRRLLARSGWRSAGVVYGLDEGDPELVFLAPAGPAGE
ncbi:GNAT family N-acetyltransferase [Streptoalloteichus hindustanus]|uniref:Acetyltransferase (GNAT) family protein n=1 Tax=Streptoalloteichus hindustanus TaxID=2017 RepID=A0A1M5EUL1_STRHI|nr:GNAT family N-acetyltransferase [Streptoalloteichus hindustanus]SHF82887.1 Acetyltransferase (GNAT) family protein [Streptoalloteichus hindustanus]